jgi:hypothetical protein
LASGLAEFKPSAAMTSTTVSADLKIEMRPKKAHFKNADDSLNTMLRTSKQ